MAPDDEGLFTIPDDELDETTDLSAAKQVAVPDYIMPSKVYDVLKWVGLIVCYALAIFVRTVGGAWHFDADVVNATATTIEAAGLCIGMCIGASQVSAMGR